MEILIVSSIIDNSENEIRGIGKKMEMESKKWKSYGDGITRRSVWWGLIG